MECDRIYTSLLIFQSKLFLEAGTEVKKFVTSIIARWTFIKWLPVFGNFFLNNIDIRLYNDGRIGESYAHLQK